MDKIPDVQKDLRSYMTEHVYIELQMFIKLHVNYF